MNKIKTFIYSLFQGMYGKVKSLTILVNDWCVSHDVYKRVWHELAEISVFGLLIWIASVPFVDLQWYWFVSYGLVPWLILEFVRQLKR